MKTSGFVVFFSFKRRLCKHGVSWGECYGHVVIVHVDFKRSHSNVQSGFYRLIYFIKSVVPFKLERPK